MIRYASVKNKASMKQEGIQLIQADALEYLQSMEENSVDLIVADPPYNVGKDYGNTSDQQDFDNYVQFSKSWTSECKRILKPTGTLYTFMGFRWISYLYQILEQDLGLLFNSWICWHYTQGTGRRRGFSPRHDDILMFNKSKDYHFYLDQVRVPQKYYRSRNNMRGANPGDVWAFSHIHYSQSNRTNHPTQKPEALIERLILASSQEGGLSGRPRF